MKILLVDDDEQMAAVVASALTVDRHVVNIATDGQIGLELAETYAYDLILLDVQLPKVDGVTVCRQLRSQGHATPILLLTARNDPDDKILGLDAGADDYVVKPFDLNELKARIRALLRRGTSPTLPILTWERLQLDPNAGEVRYDGTLLSLTRKEYCLLELFLRHPQRVFSRNIIIDRLWSSEDSPLESAVTTHIKDLRRKLKAGGLHTELIETVYGLGYRLKPPPAAAEGAASPATELPPELNAVQQVLARFRSTLTEQIAVLHEFARALQAGTATEERRRHAQQEAHKLAGSLGIFGYPDGSGWAGELEAMLTGSAPINAERYQQLVRSIEQQLSQPPLPLATPPPTAAPSTPPLTNQSAASEPLPRVLVVDDDPLVIEQLRQESIPAGVQIIGAPHPAAARDLLREIQPHLVLLDLSFSNTLEDGLTLLAELGRQDPTLPVLVFTQRQSLLDRVRVSRLGSRGFLAKSLPVEQVMQTILQVLRGTASVAARVLVVDDDADALANLTQLLQPWGLQVVPLADPQLFWDMLTATAPDLLVLDLEMPTFSGIDLCQVVRQDPQWGNLPILIATAHTDAATIQQVFAAGADDFIAKPMVGPELVTRITSRIERVRLRQQLSQLKQDQEVQPPSDALVRQTHQKLTSALQAAKIGTWQLFLPTEELLASQQCKANVGVPPEADLSYSRLLERIHPDDRALVQTRVEQSIATQTAYKAEYRCIWPDGSIHWVLASGYPTYAEDGTPIRMDGITLDITDRKHAEAALQDVLERFELVMRGSQDGIWEVRYTAWGDLDDPQREVYYSPRLRELLGYSEHEMTNTPESYMARIHPDDYERVIEAVRAHLFDRAPYQDVEHRMLTGSGEYRWVSACGQALWAEDGMPLRFAGSVRDISDRRQVEAELRQAKADLEARVAERTAELQQGLSRLQQAQIETQKFICLIESSNDFIGIASLEGQALYVNEAGQKLVGLEGDEAVQRSHVDDYFISEDLEFFRNEILPTAMQQGRWVGEYRFRHFQTGEAIPVDYNFFTVRDTETGQPIAIATVTQDIRHRKQAEAALRDSEAKFRSLCECSPIGIFMADLQGEMIYINPRGQEICGCNSEGGLGSGWLRCVHPEDRAVVAAQWMQSIAQQQRYVNAERYLHRDGTVRYGQVQTAPIFAAGGALIGYVGTIEDITESRAIEQIKNEFISVVSHELRTPLTSIHGSLGLLASGIYDDKPEKARRMIEIAVTDTDRLVRLVNDILDLERLESGKVVLEKQHCDVGELMQRSLEAMQDIAQRVDITLALTPVTAQVWANPDAIIQTLTNLLSNAIKFSPPHTTVWLSAEPLPPPLESDSLPGVRFAVRDQGRGIPADKLETIFGRFQQVDASDSRQKGGTGLGLAICQSIVQQHNGQIWAEPNADQGSTFYFTLPIAPGDEANHDRETNFDHRR